MGSLDGREVICYFDLTPNSNFYFFSREAIHKGVSEEAIKVFEKYGTYYRIQNLGGWGGGGGESILDLIQRLLSGKNFIEALLSLLTVIREIKNFLNVKISRKLETHRPTILLSLSLEQLEEGLDHSNLSSYSDSVKKRLKTLLLLNEELSERITKKYPICNIEISVGIWIKQFNYHINYKIRHNQLGPMNKLRLHRIIDSFILRNDYYMSYTFNSLGLINRAERSDIDNSGKNYYLLLSSKVISDFFYRLHQKPRHKDGASDS